VTRRRRIALWIVAVTSTLLFSFVVFLWFKGGLDAAYVWRVLWHQESNTDDYRWKASVAIEPAPEPRAWKTEDGCAAVEAAFAEDADTPAMDAYLRRGGTLGLVVVKDGTIVCEWYGNGGAADRPAAGFSVSKVVTALVLARAAATGELTLDDPITAHVSELADRDRRFEAITLAHLVDMRSGIAFSPETHFPWVDQDAPSVYYASDLARTVIRKPRIERAPGAFRYNDYAPNLIGLALARRGTTMQARTQTLWNALGAEHAARWSVDDRGFAWHESGFVATARDLARLGQLVLDDGKVGDAQVAPPVFLARSLDPARRERVTTFASTDLGYTNAWWVHGDRELFAMGKHGQVIVVSLATGTVLVRMGLDGHDETTTSIALRLARVADRLYAGGGASAVTTSPAPR
jgi:CubicO group peptidase (beta-lactamase class C family)